MTNRVLITLPLLFSLFALGCEGGKSKGECYADASAPYDQCEHQCPDGQTLVAGQCQVPDQGCPAGYTESGGECVLSSFDCETGQHEENGECVADQLTVELVSQSACWIAATGAVRTIVQYTARDESGRNVASTSGAEPNTSLSAGFVVNDRPLDIEAQLSSDSELLNSDLLVSLVLDASYSMLQHEPPAFEPMKEAAMNVLNETQSMWMQTASNFYWELLWFDSALFTPLENMAGEQWEIGDIAHIPAPVEGTYTALYKAINKMVDKHAELREQGIAAGPRDQHVMVIFSDGMDNQSHVDNSALYEEKSQDMLYWAKQGAGKTSLQEVLDKVDNVENLRTYVVGFGEIVGADGGHKQALQDIATRGGGKYFFGAETGELGALFRDVQTEFVTLQTLGAEVPLAPGQYTFDLVVKHAASQSQGSKSFEIAAGPGLGECEEPAQ